MTASTHLDEELPLTEATFLILLSLAPQPKHGYAIMKEVLSMSEGRVQLSTGTLYGALKRLLDSGWIRRTSDGETPPLSENSNRPRKAYELTEQGRQVMHSEAKRMQSLVDLASRQETEAQA